MAHARALACPSITRPRRLLRLSSSQGRNARTGISYSLPATPGSAIADRHCQLTDTGGVHGEQPSRTGVALPDHSSMSLLPLFLRPAARFLGPFLAGRSAAAAATVLHRAGVLPRNRALRRLVREGLLDGGAEDYIARLVVSVLSSLC